MDTATGLSMGLSMGLPMGLAAGQALVLAFVLLAAAFVRGYSGFGFSALVIAAGGLVSDPVALIPVVVLCELAMTLVQARGVAAQIDWRRVGAMGLGAAVTMPLAVAVLARVGVDGARLAISAMILGFSLVLLSGWTVRARIGFAGHVGAGLVSGLANGAAVGGLPIAAFMAAQPMPAAVFRATMVAYLTLIDIGLLPLLWANGLIAAGTLVATALALPILALGVWAGGRRFVTAEPADFRQMAIALLVALSGLGILRSVI